LLAPRPYRIRFGDEPVAKDDDLTPEFEHLNFPAADFDAALAEGMPDPTAETQAAEALMPEEPAGKQKGKKEREKKPKAKERPKAREKKESSEKRSFLVGFTGASPFTVLLGISLAAILIAIVYMAMQLAEYGGDYKAKSAKQSAALPAAARFVETSLIDVA